MKGARNWDREAQTLTVDKSGWQRGPWDDEPDRESFEYDGMQCLLVRGPSGAWCGYVGVDPTHPAHGKDYVDVDVDVHGGLTYAEHCQDGGPICHVPKSGEPEHLYWLGFDCAHYMDYLPEHDSDGARGAWCGAPGGSYRDINYARHQTRHLARQLAEMRGAA